MGILCKLGFHNWEYITESDLAIHRFRGCISCVKWQYKTKSDRKWQNPGTNIEGGYTTWDEMKAVIASRDIKETKGQNLGPDPSVWKELVNMEAEG